MTRIMKVYHFFGSMGIGRIITVRLRRTEELSSSPGELGVPYKLDGCAISAVVSQRKTAGVENNQTPQWIRFSFW